MAELALAFPQDSVGIASQPSGYITVTSDHSFYLLHHTFSQPPLTLCQLLKEKSNHVYIYLNIRMALLPSGQAIQLGFLEKLKHKENHTIHAL